MTQWTDTASTVQLEAATTQLTAHGFDVQVVDTKAEALEALIKLIPAKSEVMTGTSTTLNQIGFSEFLEKGDHQWKNLQAEIWTENDEAKRGDKRRLADTAEYFVASANAVTETGAIVACDATGSRVGALPFTAKNVILVIGTQKITPDVETAFQRVREFVFPLEDKRALQAYGINSSLSKWVILERESVPHRVKIVFVKEQLGF